MLLAYHVPIWMIYSGIILMTCLGGFVYFNLVREIILMTCLGGFVYFNLVRETIRYN
jgi:hypothetical protein